MEFRACKNCGDVFQWSGVGAMLCPNCKDQDEEEFDKVRRYLQDHPSMDAEIISMNTGLPVTKITQWIKSGRLVLTGKANLSERCEQCGMPIQKGKLCESCKRNLRLGFANAGLDTRRRKDTLESVKKEAMFNKGMKFIDKNSQK